MIEQGEKKMPVEFIGTSSSVIIAISLMQKNIKWLRLTNLAGALCFTYYGYLISSWPVLGLNGFIILIDLYYLLKEQFKKDQFDYLELEIDSSDYLKYFLGFHKKDILQFIPDAQMPFPEDARAFVILRNAQPVSLVVFRKETENRFRILIDYAVPQYRDRQNARFFFNYVVQHIKTGKSIEFCTNGGTKKHRKYLKSMLFKPFGETEYIRQG
jgi:hypothetical protein